MTSEEHWQQQDLIRTMLRKFINQLLHTISRLKNAVEDFDKDFSPDNCLNGEKFV